MNRILTIAAATTVVALSLAGCAADTAPGVAGPGDEPAPPAAASVGEVLGQGTVLQADGNDPQLCLGAVAESYPPQCSGPSIRGWDWEAAPMSESASGVTWGTYAVQGTWDGTAFTVTQPPIPLALYDPMPFVDPYLDEGNAGTADEAELAGVQADVDGLELTGFLGSWVQNGYVFVQVVHDGQALQDYLDARYGPDVVVVQSALRPV